MKNIVISGIGKGLGKALALEFVSKGYRVYGILRNPEQLSQFPEKPLKYIVHHY
jgi:NAD(P)-dependent dehydrogenase (short-subunit alcohol dehydrogenase family)